MYSENFLGFLYKEVRCMFISFSDIQKIEKIEEQIISEIIQVYKYYGGKMHLKEVSLLGFGICLGIASILFFPRSKSLHAKGIPVEPVKEEIEAEISTVTVSRENSVVRAVASAAPAVVAISTEVPNQNPFSWTMGTASSEGSGVVISTDGIVLTNAHVVESAISIEARFADDSVHKAEVIGISPELDLAVLQLEKKGLPAISIGTSQDLLLGESVIAIGNPFGLGHTVTTGVISAIERPLETEKRIYQDFIQTDASINPGNSGGPLINIKGELIGINTAIRSGAEGIGFAIPVDRAMKVANDLVNFGNVQRPWLGVDLNDVAFRKDGKRMVAPQVSWIYPNQTELEKGDVILKIDGKTVQGRGDLNAYLSSLSPTSNVSLEVWRGGELQTIQLKSSSLPSSVVDMTIENILGIKVRATSGKVFVSEVSKEGAFARYRLKSGDQLVAINGQKMKSLPDLQTLLANLKSEHKGSAIFTIRRGNSQGQIEIPI